MKFNLKYLKNKIKKKKMPPKKVAKVEYNNPVVEVTKRPFVATNDIQYKAMMN